MITEETARRQLQALHQEGSALLKAFIPDEVAGPRPHRWHPLAHHQCVLIDEDAAARSNGMSLIETQSFEISCPYCGETIEVVADPSVEQQSYVEDCPVCCRPMNMTVTVDDEGRAHVHAQSEDDT